MLDDKVKEYIIENFKGFSEYDEKLYNELCMLLRDNLDLKFYLHKIENKRITRTRNVTCYNEVGIIEVDANRIYRSAASLVKNETFREYSKDLESILMIKSILQMIRYIVDFKNIDKGIERDKTPIRHGIMARLGNFDLDLYARTNTDKNIVDKIFYMNSELYPNERIARIKSLESVLEVYKECNYNEYLLDDLRVWLLETKLSGYGYSQDILECPLYKFYKLIGKPDCYVEKFYPYYDLRERLEMGMPISEEELMSTVIDTLELDSSNDKVLNFARTYVK